MSNREPFDLIAHKNPRLYKSQKYPNSNVVLENVENSNFHSHSSYFFDAYKKLAFFQKDALFPKDE